MTPPTPLVIARGARAAEAFLLAELRRLQAEARADLRLLAVPVRVVVPSRSLRDHLAAELVAELGGAAGLQIQTLRSLAFEVLERAGEGARGGQALVPVLVRRFAAEEPALADALASFDDGYAVAVASVNDLLDAGLDASNAPSLHECLSAAGGSATPATLARAEALVRVAERVADALAERGLEPRAGFFARARAQLLRAPELLPARALFVHGWADVTGVQLDLLETLVRAHAGRVVLDHPPEPADPAAEGPGERWTERLRLRLGGAEPSLAPPSETATLEAIEAPGTHAESRAVANRIRALLDGGERPESVGIVLRDPLPYRHALFAQLSRLGIPFSGRAGSVGPAGRSKAALLALIESAEACPADRWLDAQARLGRDRLADLRLAFHGIGVGRLGDVAALDLGLLLGPRESYALPIRRGIFAGASVGESASAPADGEGAAAGDDAETLEREPEVKAARARRRTVSREALETAIGNARALLERIAALRSAKCLGDQLDALRALLARELGWRPEAPLAAGEVYAALTRLEAEIGAETELSPDELLVVLRRATATLGRESLGGSGGGVAVLSALESRGRTFRQLFVMGMNRDVFPRLVREDPLLPDELRRALEVVLPDIPVKQRGEQEERYLFASLGASAPSVTLSWLATSDDGKERPASPLVEPLRTAGLDITAAPLVLASASGPRPAFEHAIRAGIARERALGEGALGVALGSAELAHARAEATGRLDVGGWAEELGPYFGFVGAMRGDDPRAAELAITRLEGMARCGWQTFLERVLGLEPPPDALAELPDATPLLVGNVVHAVMEQIVGAAGGAVQLSLDQARTLAPVVVPWPAPATLAAHARSAAQDAARAEGIVLPGFAALLARRALPLLERIRELDWGAGAGPAVLGAEVQGAAVITRADGTQRPVRFRADRADAEHGGVVLVDYKTGAPISKAKKAATRTDHLLAQIARGQRLQGPAYAQAGEGVRAGRYLFAKPELEDEWARVSIERDDVEARERFAAAATELLAAFELGAFPPRLLGDKRVGSGPACNSCEVAEACLQGETGSRRHLAAWLTRHEVAPERLPPGARAALALLTRVERK